MRILAVEDNRSVAQALRKGLKPQYAIDVVQNGADGLMLAESTAYDVILLDLGLPDFGGEEICTELRKNGNKTPIIIISGEDHVSAKVRLLDSGADDYLTKPFRLEELHARIRSALRHKTSQIANAIVVGDLVVDTASHTVSRAGIPITLRRKEFALLELLARNAGRTLTRPVILEHLWDMNENLWANVVDVHIKHLRDKIDKPFETPIIITVHGLGYRLDPGGGAGG